MLQSSIYQAAVILKSLPKRQAAKILSRLEAVDIKTVLDALDHVDGYTASEISSTLQKLTDESGQSLFQKQAQELGHFPDQFDTDSASSSLEDDPNFHPFAFITNLTLDIRDQLLRDEHPKNIAIVLASLPPEIASDVIRQLDPVIRVSVLRRLCDMGISAKEESVQLSYILKLRLRKILNKNSYNKTGVDVVAELLSFADPETQRDVLAHMNQTDPELADKLEDSVFVFSDIQSLHDDAIRTLLKKTDTSLWAPALKRATMGIRQKILSNMAEPVAILLSEEISTIGPIDDHISNRAQQQIVNLILRIRRAESSGQNLNLVPPKSRSNPPYHVPS